MLAPTTLVLFHCRFGAYGLAEHGTHSFDLQTYLSLPHLYALCAIDETLRPERMTSGLLVKTNLRYEDPCFLDGMSAAFQAVPQLMADWTQDIALLPSPVDPLSPRPMTEDDALYVFRTLWAAHVTSLVLPRDLG